jgi:xanthine phosphoribosyltransferase
VEASGIAIAAMVGYVFGCPLVFAKKSKTKNISDEVWSAEVESFTHGGTNTIVVSKEYLGADDRVLIVDDFLATGAALFGLREICRQAGAEVGGAGIAVEKAFQGGGKKLREEGMRVESLAKIASMSDNGLEFEK